MREADLLALYDAALGLTERMGEAIAQEAWDELARLLVEREALIPRIEALVAGPPPQYAADLKARLERLLSLDTTHAARLGTRQAELGQRMQQLGRSRVAMQGYLPHLASEDAAFIDQDR